MDAETLRSGGFTLFDRSHHIDDARRILQGFTLQIDRQSGDLFSATYVPTTEVIEWYTGNINDKSKDVPQIIRDGIDYGIVPVYVRNREEKIEDIIDESFFGRSGFLALGTFFCRLPGDNTPLPKYSLEEPIAHQARIRVEALAGSALERFIKDPHPRILKGEMAWWLMRWGR